MKSNNFKDVYTFLEMVNKSIKDGTDNGLYLFCKKTLKQINTDSKEQKHGNIYTIYKNGKRIKHTASKEFQESSSRLTGQLNKARDFKVNNLIAKIGVDKKIQYAKFIEDTRQDTKRGVEKKLPEIEQDILLGIKARMQDYFK